MNVYTCLYRGNIGYGCRTRGRNWMFVPEMGQPDGTIYKNLLLHDLVFKNPFEKKFELSLERESRAISLSRVLRWLFLPRRKLQTIGGLLLSPV
jgi:hypothetical protein